MYVGAADGGRFNNEKMDADEASEKLMIRSFNDQTRCFEVRWRLKMSEASKQNFPPKRPSTQTFAVQKRISSESCSDFNVRKERCFT